MPRYGMLHSDRANPVFFHFLRKAYHINGRNSQHLRKLYGNMTQEKLAERMDVSRQTVSKWETDETCSELEKLLARSELFSCTLDALLKEAMKPQADYFPPVPIIAVPKFSLGPIVSSTRSRKTTCSSICRAGRKAAG